MIELIVFDPQYNKRPIASIDFDAFNPIPLPLIALASVGVSVQLCLTVMHCNLKFFQLRYALDEYQTGILQAKHFTETEYKPRYKAFLVSLKAMDKSPEKWMLDDVRAAMLKSGR